MSNTTSLKNLVVLGKCEAGLCEADALADISLDTIEFFPETGESRAIPKQVKVCFPHKMEYFNYQEKLLDKINPERKKQNGKH